MTARQRGQPLIFLAMIMVLWVGVRILAWSHAATEPLFPAVVKAAHPNRSPVGQAAKVPIDRPPMLAARPGPIAAAALRPVLNRLVSPTLVERVEVAATGSAERQAEALPAMARGMPGAPVSPAAAQLPQPPTVAASPIPGPPLRRRERRWSGDAWALVRGGSGPGSAGPGVATYGGNQIGAVLRYRLVPGSAHRPTAYFRASAALNGSGEREAALGLSIRPVAAVPVILAGEARVGVLSGEALARPAVMIVTEIPPVDLPGRIRAEFYTQAGYVGGAGATPFADGQLRVDRRVVQAGPVELRAGVGAWGGAQRGAARFDVGPGATIGIAKGSAGARIGLDWRFRIAGAAEPASGPALTVSAGF